MRPWARPRLARRRGRPSPASPAAIVASMVNPTGPAPERESVLLINASPSAVDLSGWRIADRVKRACAVPGGSLAPGATRSVPLTDGVPLGNKGGAITLLDARGLKVDGVAYAEEQAGRGGWTVLF
jgi:Lamin Tail Domain